MSKKEKSTAQNVIVRLLSKDPITYAAAVFALASCIDSEELGNENLLILGYDFNDTDLWKQSEKKTPSETGKKLRTLAERSPGALGDLWAFVRGYKWYQIYMGFAGIVIFGSLILKWILRAITGNF